MRVFIPIFLALVGTSMGVVAALYLSEPDEVADTGASTAEQLSAGSKETDIGSEGPKGEVEYVKLANQFVIPVILDGEVEAMVVLSLSIEVAQGQSEGVYQKEPKLRDRFLFAMFRHANSGGFDGNYTDADRLNLLRNALLSEASDVLGSAVSNVLITDFAKQST